MKAKLLKILRRDAEKTFKGYIIADKLGSYEVKIYRRKICVQDTEGSRYTLLEAKSVMSGCLAEFYRQYLLEKLEKLK